MNENCTKFNIEVGLHRLVNKPIKAYIETLNSQFVGYSKVS